MSRLVGFVDWLAHAPLSSRKGQDHQPNVQNQIAKCPMGLELLMPSNWHAGIYVQMCPYCAHSVLLSLGYIFGSTAFRNIMRQSILLYLSLRTCLFQIQRRTHWSPKNLKFVSVFMCWNHVEMTFVLFEIQWKSLNNGIWVVWSVPPNPFAQASIVLLDCMECPSQSSLHLPPNPSTLNMVPNIFLISSTHKN